LFEWSLRLRNKQEAKKLLDTESLTPVVHSSGRIPAARGSTSLMLPLMPHPINDKAVIVFDLMGDARALTQCDADAVRDRVFTPVADLPEDVERLPLKVIKWNAVPMLAPSGVLNGVDLQRIGLDLSRCEENAELLKRHIHTVRRAVAEAFQAPPPDEGRDPELALYGGGFFDDADRRLMQAIHRTSPEELSKKAWDFHDARLPLMLLRFRARNWPDTLSQSEWEAWNQDRATRLLAPEGSPFYGQDAFKSDLLLARESHRGDPKAIHILDALEAWSRDLDLKAHISNL
jgi:exodeoxyribonuclease-1